MIEFMFGFYNTDGSDLTLLELYQLIGGDLNQLTNYLGQEVLTFRMQIFLDGVKHSWTR